MQGKIIEDCAVYSLLSSMLFDIVRFIAYTLGILISVLLIMTYTISNRDLLRNYKALKMKLSSGEVDALHIPQDDGSIIQMTIMQPKSRTQQLLEMIRKRPLKNIVRPDFDLFD